MKDVTLSVANLRSTHAMGVTAIDHAGAGVSGPSNLAHPPMQVKNFDTGLPSPCA